MANANPSKPVISRYGRLVLEPLNEEQMLNFFLNCYRVPEDFNVSEGFTDLPFAADLPDMIKAKQQEVLNQEINYSTILMGTHMSIMTPLTLQKPSTRSHDANTGLPLGLYPGINKEGETHIEYINRLKNKGGYQHAPAAAAGQAQTAITIEIPEGDMVFSIHTLPGFSATNTGNFPPALFLFNGLNAPTFEDTNTMREKKQIRRSPLEHLSLIGNAGTMARTGKYSYEQYEAKVREDGLNYFGVGGQDTIPNFWCGGDYEDGSVAKGLIMGTYLVSWGVHEGNPELPMVYVVSNTRTHAQLRPRETGASIIHSEYTTRAIFELVNEKTDPIKASGFPVFRDFFISACQVIDEKLGSKTPEARQLAESYTNLMLNMVIAQEKVLSTGNLIIRKRTHSMNASLAQLDDEDRGAIAEAEEHGGDYKTLKALQEIRFPNIGGIAPNQFLHTAYLKYNVLSHPIETIYGSEELIEYATQLGIVDRTHLAAVKEGFDQREDYVIPAFTEFLARAFGISLQGGGRRKRRRYNRKRKTKKRGKKGRTWKRKTRNNRKSRHA